MRVKTRDIDDERTLRTAHRTIESDAGGFAGCPGAPQVEAAATRGAAAIRNRGDRVCHRAPAGVKDGNGKTVRRR